MHLYFELFLPEVPIFTAYGQNHGVYPFVSIQDEALITGEFWKAKIEVLFRYPIESNKILVIIRFKLSRGVKILD